MKFLSVIFLCLFTVVIGWMIFAEKSLSYERNAVIQAQSETPIPTPTTQTELNSKKLWTVVNYWRENHGFEPYIYDPVLCDIAKIRLDEIQSEWSHNKFNFKRFSNLLTYVSLAENLARYNPSEYVTLSSWERSPSHREILDKPFTHSCIETQGTYAVQIFGSFNVLD